jgi:hypothetical protein
MSTVSLASCYDSIASFTDSGGGFGALETLTKALYLVLRHRLAIEIKGSLLVISILSYSCLLSDIVFLLRSHIFLPAPTADHLFQLTFASNKGQ